MSNNGGSTDLVLARKKVDESLAKLELRLGSSIPSHITAERLVRVAQTAISRNPRLLECSTLSVVRSITEGAQLGLEVSSPLKEAYLIPRWSAKAGAVVCHFQPGFRGIVKLVRNTGYFRHIDIPRAVFEGDDFDYGFGGAPFVTHRPTPGVEHSWETLLYTYVCAWTPEGDLAFEVMTKAEITTVRDAIKDWQKGPWGGKDRSTDPVEMGKKTVVHKFAKNVPQGPELAAAVEMDQALDRGAPVELASLDPKFGQMSEEEAERYSAEAAMQAAATAKGDSDDIAPSVVVVDVVTDEQADEARALLMQCLEKEKADQMDADMLDTAIEKGDAEQVQAFTEEMKGRLK